MNCLISFKNTRSCFVNIPDSLLLQLDGPIQEYAACLQISTIEKERNPISYFLGISGLPSSFSTHDTIEIDPIYAHTLGLSESERVYLYLIKVESIIERLEIRPVSPDDWEIAEQNANWLETNFFNSYRIISRENFPIFLPSGTAITFQMVNAEPNFHDCGRLNPSSEVLVSPILREKVSESNSGVTLRCVIENDLLPRDAIINHPELCVYIPQVFGSLVDSVFIEPLEASFSSPLVVRAIQLPFQWLGQFFVSGSLASSYSFVTGDFFKIWPADVGTMSSKFILRPLNQESMEEFVTNSVVSRIKFSYLINGMELQIPDLNAVYSVEGRTGYVENEESITVDSSLLSFNDKKRIVHNKTRITPNPFQGLMDSILTSANFGYNVLVNGIKGSGKTTLLKSLLQSCCFSTVFHTEFVSCTDLNLSSFSKFEGFWDQLILRSLKYSPTILFLDDFDSLLVSENESDELTFVSERQAQYLVERLSYLKSIENISIVATVKDLTKYPTDLKSRFFFQQRISIPAMTYNGREEMLNFFFKELNQILPKECLQILSKKTDGFTLLDLSLVTKRVYSELTLLDSLENFGRVNESINTILKGYVPLNSRKTKFVKYDIDWNSITGMRDAKSVLHDIIESPVKYHAIYKQCSLRLPTGVLLYGYSGCGKTHLASSISNAFPVQLISIKGPEILDKYIGSSEQAIRNLFERAQLAKPCVLFFDEFDSIAPRRGQDTTGVTDRVVNQLLTQLDGAEQYEGVYVVAATTRPDMIDPALLRPGRLDKLVLCDLPSKKERKDFFLKILDKYQVADKSVVGDLVPKTEGYSYADLSSIFTEAHLIAVHQHLEKENSFPRNEKLRSLTNLSTEVTADKTTLASRDTELTYGLRKLEISKENILNALRKTNSSVSGEEYSMLSSIYKHYAHSSLTNQKEEIKGKSGYKTRQA
ncbi:AAA family ATPase Pex1 [Schizosaccharomyces cryophilus OY26]|uniref:Peroxisomal ATPase PEX1 n=1 Tax=Schizosaccharomyces cryophilus (strain OY26 / ATCC MYA-4695 / CBS 11777 / NBRC 106824 / NRRL Y48691) TaxID=653667 RepID=S9WZ77_SCHCR|nr:AAA family ATPase Pex1 [Schizosaccharomyces cryophilus OY26]EPY50012.1 AAA family ATPase Pex1 [Schizosaccharomyces cryophilus OY26]